MILDARRSNCYFSKPPHTELLTSEGLGDIEMIELQDLPGESETFILTVATADIDNCFHRLIMPGWMSVYFAYPGVTGKESGRLGLSVEGSPVGHDDWVFPCARALPMGFTWSLHLAQKANERQCLLEPLLSDSILFNDRNRPMLVTLSPQTYGQLWHYAYVDNIGIIGRDPARVHDAMESL